MWPWAIQLKTTPPTLSANSLSRSRLSFERYGTTGSNLLEVSAPQGFGKTHLLVQWYGQAREQGKAVIWLSLDDQYDARRFAEGLAGASTRKGQAVLDGAFANWVRDSDDALAALTGWIVEIAQCGQECILFLDDADLVPAELLETGMAFILANAPGNLRIVLSTRPGNTLFRAPPLIGTPVVRITAHELRFTEEETLAVMTRSLRAPFSGTLAPHLQRLADGWPLGIQLALASQIGRGNARAPEEAVSIALGKYFTDVIMTRQPVPVKDMLVALALLDPIHPALIQAVAGADAPVAILDRLADTTPLIIRSQDGDWMRLHPAAAELLADQHRALPAVRQQEVSRAATHWYAANGLYEEAAREAGRAGDTNAAVDLAEMAVRAMTAQGRPSDVTRWIERLSPDDLQRRPSFWLPAAWAYANGNRPDKVRPLLALLHTKSDLGKGERFEVALLEGAMAGYRDDHVTLQSFNQDWPEAPTGSTASERLLHALLLATERILAGDPAEGRAILEATGPIRRQREVSLIVRSYTQYYIGLSFLWEGKPAMAHDILAPAMEELLAECDQRSVAVSLIAALLAETATEMMQFEEARSILGGRMAMIEKLSSPDALIAGYLAASRLAQAEGRLDLAEAQISAMVTTGKARQLPRVEAVGLAHLARFHARHGHVSLARAASLRLEALEAGLSPDISPPIRAIITLQANLTRALLPERTGDASPTLAAQLATRQAQALCRGHDQLLAVALHGRSMLSSDALTSQSYSDEALATAKDWSLRHLQTELTSLKRNPREGDPTVPPAAEPESPSITDGIVANGILTRREYDILCGIAAHLSNKEIALSLGLSNETVKWHVKNLFQKLEAGERKVAVARARMLGLL